MPTRQDMSDSSLGDSLFSCDANKCGSSDSCRFNEDCKRRCSLENEKCSFSDTCRYECNIRNCDCSSSYFSSDFDDTNIYNTSRKNYQIDETDIYADDHFNLVKKNEIVTMENLKILSNQKYETSRMSPKQLNTECKISECDRRKNVINIENKKDSSIKSDEVAHEGKNIVPFEEKNANKSKKGMKIEGCRNLHNSNNKYQGNLEHEDDDVFLESSIKASKNKFCRRNINMYVYLYNMVNATMTRVGLDILE